MNFKKTEYENTFLADILDAMMKASGEFDTRKRGPAFRAVLFTLADVFQEDRPVMYKQFGNNPRQKKEIASGGAKITRHRDQVAARTSTKKKGCAGCPEPKGVHAGTPAGQTADKMPGTRNKETITVQFTDIDDLRAKFEDNTTAMRAYAQANDIKISAAVTKPGTMARILFEKLYPASEEEE